MTFLSVSRERSCLEKPVAPVPVPVSLYRLDEEMGSMVADAAGLAPGDITGASWAAYPAGVCAPRCGDGVLGYAEECDDGNLDAGDGCDPICACEEACAPVMP